MDFYSENMTNTLVQPSYGELWVHALARKKARGRDDLNFVR